MGVANFEMKNPLWKRYPFERFFFLILSVMYYSGIEIGIRGSWAEIFLYVCTIRTMYYVAQSGCLIVHQSS